MCHFALAAYRASSLAARRFEWAGPWAWRSPTMDSWLAAFGNHLLHCTSSLCTARWICWRRCLRLPTMAKEFRDTQCISRLIGPMLSEILAKMDAMPLSSLMQACTAIATFEATGDAPDDFDDDYGPYEPIRDVAVHGNQVIVLTSDSHATGSGLRLLDLDGRFLRTIAAKRFRNPRAVTASYRKGLCV